MDYERVDSYGARTRTQVERWDEPMVRLNDREQIRAYARSHLIPEQFANRVDPPITLTKRGCLIWAQKD